MGTIGYLAFLFLVGGFSTNKLAIQNCSCIPQTQNIILTNNESKIVFRETGKRCKLKLNLKIDFTDSAIDESYKISICRSRGIVFSTITRGKSYVIDETIRLRKKEGAWLVLSAGNKGFHIASINPLK